MTFGDPAPSFFKYSPDQPRVPAGSSGGGQWTSDGGGGSSGSRELTLVAQADEASRQAVNLPEEDARGGHTVRDHVGKTNEELLAITERNVFHTLSHSLYGISYSTFLSLESANDFVNRVLVTNRSAVDLVSSGALEEEWLEMRFGYPTGKEAFRASPEERPYVRPTYSVGVSIRHDPRSNRGYRVHTAYPLNEKPK